MALREFVFTVGPETSELPNVGTPTDGDDLITYDFAEGRYTRLVQYGAPVADPTALIGISAANRSNGMIALVMSNDRMYRFDSSSSASDDGDLVLQPSVGTGRWLKILGALAKQDAGASSTLTQYNTDVGNSSNTRTPSDTNLLGDVRLSTAVVTFVDANVTTGTDNIAITSHGLVTGDKAVLTSSGTLPAGLSLATTYYIVRIDANNIKLASSYANSLVPTVVDITAAAGGGTHSVTSGGAKFKSDASTVYSNLAQPGFYAHKNASDQTWNAAGDTPAKVTFGTQRWFRGAASDYASSTYTVPVAGIWQVVSQVTFYTTVATFTYRIFIYKNGSRINEAEFVAGAASASGQNELTPRITLIDSFAASDTIEIYCESNRNHSGTTATIKGNDKQTFFNMMKLS